MELVRGQPITRYCDEHRLGTAERLELFMQVCQAVQHAHQKGVIHRDLKPGNILVMEQDGRAVPKVIDFGVAKALGQPLTEKSAFTRFGQMVGTPAYMSPEQASLGGLDIDTRSDVYSLGAVLYELLTGRPPFEPRQLLVAGFEAILRTIREEEPPRPSTRLGTLSEEEARTTAEQRRMEPGKLSRVLRGELDWIVMKALEKDRGRRYETVNGLARDVERYLSGEWVVARPPSTGYRVVKWIRRHRTVAATAVAFVAVLAGGVFVSSWQAREASRHAREAELRGLEAKVEAARAQTALEESERARRQEQFTAYVNSIALAYREYLNGDEVAVRRTLDGCARELRGWEWHHLQHLASSALWTAKLGLMNPSARPETADFGERSARVAFTDGGQFLAVFGYPTAPVLFDPLTGSKVFEWEGVWPRLISGSSFSLDGRWLAVFSRDQVRMIATEAPNEAVDSAEVWRSLVAPESDWIRVRAQHSGELQITGIPLNLFAVPRLNEGRGLPGVKTVLEAFGDQFEEVDCFLGDWGDQVILWVAQSSEARELVAECRTHHAWANVERLGEDFVFVSPRGDEEDGTAEVRVTSLTRTGVSWELILPDFSYPMRTRLTHIRNTPHLLVACVSVLRERAGLLVYPLSESRTPPATYIPLDDGRMNWHRLVTFMSPWGGGGTLGPFYGILDLMVDTASKTLVTAGLDAKVRILDLDFFRERSVFRGHGAAISSTALSPDESLMASATADGEVGVWLRRGALAAEEIGRFELDLVFRPSPQIGFDPRHGVVWGPMLSLEDPVSEDVREHLIVDLASRDVRAVPGLQTISHDGRRALGKVSRSEHVIIDIATGQLLSRFPVRTARDQESRFTGDLEWELLVTSPGHVHFYRTANGERSPAWLQVDGPDSVAAINKDGTVLIIRGAPGSFSIFQLCHATGVVTQLADIEANQFLGFFGEDRYMALAWQEREKVLIIATSSGKVKSEVPMSPSSSVAGEDLVRINAARTVLFSIVPEPDGDPVDGTRPSPFGTPATVHLWSDDHGMMSFALRALPLRLDLSPDGRRLACSFLDGTLVLVDTETGQLVCAFDNYGHVLGFAENGAHLLAGHPDGRVLRYDGSSFEDRPSVGAVGRPFADSIRQTLREEREKRIAEEARNALQVRHQLERPWTATAAISPTTNTFAIITQDGDVALCDFEGSVLKTFFSPGDDVTSLAYSPDGDELLLGLRGGRIIRWAPVQDAQELVLDQTNRVIKVGWLGPSGRVVWSKSQTGNHVGAGGEVIDLATGATLLEFECFVREDFQSWAVPMEGQALAVTDIPGKARGIYILNADTGAIEAELTGHSPLSVVFSREGGLLAAGHAPYDITLWDWPGQRQLRFIDAHDNWVVSLAFSRDNTMLLSGSGDSTARIWEVSTGREVGRLRFPGSSTYVGSVGFSADGKFVLAAAHGLTFIADSPSLVSASPSIASPPKPGSSRTGLPD
jgi:WD40 repeat protein